MHRIVTLTTDFGWRDVYVAAMKGVILGINPDAVIVDISHSVEPQRIEQAAFLLESAWEYFPQGTIHIVVVDPGVGTTRRGIALETDRAVFVAPDNGVLSTVIFKHLTQDSCRADEAEGYGEQWIPEHVTAVSLTNPKYWRSPVSSTFHGRDIFAPVAAHLSVGIPLTEFGERIDSLIALRYAASQKSSIGGLIGHVIHIDNFGNLITDITEEQMKEGKPTLKIGDQCIEGLCKTYAEGEGLLALIGSSGRLEIALKNGSAEKLLKAKIGDSVKVG